jgi:putative SbcD/Mre11-related phosphoesterase
MDLPLAENFLATPDRFLFHSPTATAICADFHLGVESDLRAAGTAMPDFSIAPIAAAWEKLLARNPRRIIIAGDLFHSRAPARETLAVAKSLFEKIPKNCALAITPGNHDPAPASMRQMLSDTPAEIADTVEVADWTIAHGDNLRSLPAPLPRLIVGHQHPSLVLANKIQSAKMICFATVSDHLGPRILLLPAFSAAPLGSSLRQLRNWIIDAPRPDMAQVRIAGIVKNSVLDFGPLDKLN